MVHGPTYSNIIKSSLEKLTQKKFTDALSKAVKTHEYISTSDKTITRVVLTSKNTIPTEGLFRLLIAESATGFKYSVIRKITGIEVKNDDACAKLIRTVLGVLATHKFNNDNTPLQIAVHEDKVELLELLMQHGADPDKKNRSGHTPLGLAAQENNKNAFWAMVNSPHYVPTKNISLAILDAVAVDDLEAVKALLEKARKAGLFDKNKNLLNQAYDSSTENYTLHVAVEHDNGKMVALLVHYGANPDETNSSGHTPLGLAAQKNNMDAFWAMVNSPYYIPTESISLAILDAVAKDDVEAVQALLEKACKAGLFDKNKNLLNQARYSSTENYMLHLAVEHGNEKMVALLVQYGADPDKTNSSGETPLGLTLQKNKMDTFWAIVNASHYVQTDAVGGRNNSVQALIWALSYICQPSGFNAVATQRNESVRVSLITKLFRPANNEDIKAMLKDKKAIAEALKQSVDNNSVSVVRTFLANVSDEYIKSLLAEANFINRMFWWAAEEKYIDIVNRLVNVFGDSITDLLSAKVNDGKTPFMWTAEEGLIDHVDRFLKAYKGSLRHMLENKKSAVNKSLLLAVAGGHAEVVYKILIACKEESSPIAFKKVDSVVMSALFKAMNSPHKEVVIKILQLYQDDLNRFYKSMGKFIRKSSPLNRQLAKKLYALLKTRSNENLKKAYLLCYSETDLQRVAWYLLFKAQNKIQALTSDDIQVLIIAEKLDKRLFLTEIKEETILKRVEGY